MAQNYFFLKMKIQLIFFSEISVEYLARECRFDEFNLNDQRNKD